jgi:hypothetical protein
MMAINYKKNPNEIYEHFNVDKSESVKFFGTTTIVIEYKNGLKKHEYKNLKKVQNYASI